MRPADAASAASGPWPQAVDHDDHQGIGLKAQCPGVAADRLAGVGHRHRTDVEVASSVDRRSARPEPRQQAGAELPCRRDVDGIGGTVDGAKAGTRASGGRVPVAQARGDVGDAAAQVEGENVEPPCVPARRRKYDAAARVGVFEDVSGGFGHHQGDAAQFVRREAHLLGQPVGFATRVGHVGRLLDVDDVTDHSQRVMAMVVPSPT